MYQKLTRPVFRKLGMIAEKTSCAIVLIGHLNKSSGTQSTYRGLGSVDIMAAVRSLIFIGKVRKDPTTRVLIHEKSSLAPPGETMAFKLGDILKSYRLIKSLMMQEKGTEYYLKNLVFNMKAVYRNIGSLLS